MKVSSTHHVTKKGTLKKNPSRSGVVVYDDGGETADRYTIFIGGSVYGADTNPYHPQGFGQYVGESSKIPRGSHLGKVVPVGSLTPETQRFIAERME